MYKTRQERAAAWLGSQQIDAAFIQNDSDVRYLTGMPYGSLLFLFAGGKTILVPWDAILAEKIAYADEILPYTAYGRVIENAFAEVLKLQAADSGSRVEIPASTTYLRAEKLKRVYTDNELICRDDGFSTFLHDCRMVKDKDELEVLKRAASLTDQLLDELIEQIRHKNLDSETDVALFLESEARKRGAEGMGFETIAAGPTRSFGIHAFPAYTKEAFGTPGMSILDCGVRIDGYTSDITLTLVRGTISPLQEQMVSLVQKAYDRSAEMVKPGANTYTIARAVDELFSEHDFSMPHALGHGIGLDVHEAPTLRNRESDSVELQPGMVITLEPGLYHADAGGVRLENDFLVTETGCKALTNSRILRAP